MGLAGPANRQGRIAGSNAMGLNLRYSGVLGTRCACALVCVGVWVVVVRMETEEKRRIPACPL